MPRLVPRFSPGAVFSGAEPLLMPGSSERHARKKILARDCAGTSEAFDHPGGDGDARLEIAATELTAAFVVDEVIRFSLGRRDLDHVEPPVEAILLMDFRALGGDGHFRFR